MDSPFDEFEGFGKEKRRIKNLADFIEVAADISQILLLLRDKPKLLDWIAVGVQGLGSYVKIKKKIAKRKEVSSWGYFDYWNPHSKWSQLPDIFTDIMMKLVEEVKILQRPEDEKNEDDPRVCIGNIKDQVIGWLQLENKKPISSIFVLKEKESETNEVIGKAIWRYIGSSHCAYTANGLEKDILLDSDIVPTVILKGLLARIVAFRKHDIPRSYMLTGPPGTGKSIGIRWLISKLGASSFRVDMGVLSKVKHGEAKAAASLMTNIKIMKPDILILEDIDHFAFDGDLLTFLERITRFCSVVLATANDPDKLSDAVRRPERFDEEILIDHLDDRVLKLLVKDDAAVLKLKLMPAVYVSDFLKRRVALGNDQAMLEIDELIKRAARKNKKEKEEEDNDD